MSLVVNKPQFDTNILKPGVAILVKYSSTHPIRSLRSKQRNGIIIESSPLSLSYVYYNSSESEDEHDKILIKDFVSKDINIVLLTPKEDN